jgi:hypothetical protein
MAEIVAEWTRIFTNIDNTDSTTQSTIEIKKYI